MRLIRRALFREMRVATIPRAALMLQRRVQQQAVNPSDESFGEDCAHHVPLRHSADRVAGEQCQRWRRSLLGDPDSRRLHDAMSRDFVLVCLVLYLKRNHITALQFVNVQKWCVGRCAMSAKNYVAVSSG